MLSSVQPYDYLQFVDSPIKWDWGVPCIFVEHEEIGLSLSLNQNVAYLAETACESLSAKRVDANALKNIHRLVIDNVDPKSVESLLKHANKIQEIHLFADDLDQANRINSILVSRLEDKIESVGIYVPGQVCSLLGEWRSANILKSISIGISTDEAEPLNDFNVLKYFNNIECLHFCCSGNSNADENAVNDRLLAQLEVLASMINRNKPQMLRQTILRSMGWMEASPVGFFDRLSSEIKSRLDSIGIVGFPISNLLALEIQRMLHDDNIKFLDMEQSEFECANDVNSILKCSEHLYFLGLSGVGNKTANTSEIDIEERGISSKFKGIKCLNLSECVLDDICIRKAISLVGPSTTHLDINNVELSSESAERLEERLALTRKFDHLNLSFQPVATVLRKLAKQEKRLAFLGLRGVDLNALCGLLPKDVFPQGVSLAVVGDNENSSKLTALLQELRISCISAASKIDIWDNVVVSQQLKQINLIGNEVTATDILRLKFAFPNLKYVVGLHKSKDYGEFNGVMFISLHFLLHQHPADCVEIISGLAPKSFT